jgi:hypothetical protein
MAEGGINNHAGFIWSVADLLRGDYKQADYGKVILPRAKKYPVEVRERAVRLILEHRGEYNTKWAAIPPVAEKIGCSAERLRSWLREAELD